MDIDAWILLQGERDYAALKGPTGPLVYPAGHLYLYTWLHALTGGGSIQAAQAIFAVLYWLNQVPLAQPARGQAQNTCMHRDFFAETSVLGTHHLATLPRASFAAFYCPRCTWLYRLIKRMSTFWRPLSILS